MSSLTYHKKTAKQLVGAWGEERASLFLVDRGYKIVRRNYRIKNGEIDIIAWHKKPHFGATLCFIEVKTRSDEIGTAERATNKEKLQRLFQAARHYCIKYDIQTDRTPIQFEQVSVYIKKGRIKPRCQLFVIPVA